MLDDRPHSSSLRRWLVGAKLAGAGPRLGGTVDRDDHAYRFRSNEQAAEVAMIAVVEWLRVEGGRATVLGRASRRGRASRVLHAAADRIERQEKIQTSSMIATTDTYENRYARSRHRFEQETREHELTVLRDDGLYRHLRCKPPESYMYGFICKHCAEPAPHEWGADRRCPEHPKPARPVYMQSCEYEAIPIRLTCGACLFPGDENAIFGHSHGEGCVLGDES